MSEEHWEEDEAVRAPRKRKTVQADRSPAVREGQISAIGPHGCSVVISGDVVPCKPKADLTIGDYVAVDSQGNIRQVLSRRTTLSRPDPGNPRIERVVAANVDVVVMVAAIAHPPLRPGLIDRYLIAIEKGGAEPVLCVTKIDLVRAASELESLDIYRQLGIRIFPLSVRTGEGIEDFRDALSGKLAVLVGHSGVGKSSLMNALAPGVRAATGDLSAAHAKGRHTTTGSTMYFLPGGLRLIDTPGVREFGFWDLTAADVERHFHDFAPFRVRCQFGDCTHTHEPVCGVKGALNAGEISPERYRAYLRLRADLIAGSL